MPQSPMCGPRGSSQFHLTSFSSLRPHYHPVLPLKNLLFFHTPLAGLSFLFPILYPMEATITIYILYAMVTKCGVPLKLLNYQVNRFMCYNLPCYGHQLWCTAQTLELLNNSFYKKWILCHGHQLWCTAQTFKFQK